MIPNNIYYVFGLKKQTEEFLFIYYMSVLSAKLVNQPDHIYFYYHYMPHGKWWEKTKKLVTLKKINKIPEYWGSKKINHYAHAADKYRMDLLYENGGIYMDMDTISLRSYKFLLNRKCVMGKQVQPEGLCNAIMLVEPKSKFFKLWLDNYENYFISTKPGTNGWDLASIRLPYVLYDDIVKDGYSSKENEIVTVINPECFFLPNWNETEKIFKINNEISKNLLSLHLWESNATEFIKNIKDFDWIYKNKNTLYAKIVLELIKKYKINTGFDEKQINEMKNNSIFNVEDDLDITKIKPKDNIPNIIHQTWKTTKTPEKMDFCIESWKKLNTNYQYMLWTDEDIDNFIKEKYLDYYDLLKKLKHGIQKADLFRILVLHYYGGIYADIDFECLLPINYWNINDSKINISYEPKEHHKTNVICNALIATPKKMDILLDIIKYGENIIEKNKDEVMNSFGPLAWTKVLHNNLDLNVINTNLFYPIPDITINNEIETKYKNIIINRKYNNSYAIHYWEHSNWPRTNILDKYYKDLYPKIKINSINICGLYRNYSSYFKEYLIPKFNKLEKIYPYIQFYYYFYENDSIDSTKEILSDFCIDREAQLLTEINNTKLYERNPDKNRIENINNCRNKLLSLRPFKGEWTIMIDSDIEFHDNLISRFIAKNIPDDLVALTCNGKDHKKCKLNNNMHHYYDTLGLVYENGNSGFKYFSRNQFQSCPLEDKIERERWFNNELIKTKSSFGGLSFYKSDIINKDNVKYSVEKHKDIDFYCEHLGFNQCLVEYGDIYIDPTFIVYNVENDKYLDKINIKKWPVHPDFNLPMDLSNIYLDMDIILCSFGGCYSEVLANYLENNNYRIETDLYHKLLCHLPSVIKTNKPIIYLYRDIRDAFNMVKYGRIGSYDFNIKKLSNDKNVIISDENLLKLMIQQFNNFTKNIENNNKILFLSYDDMYTEKGLELLREFLDNNNLEKIVNTSIEKKYKFPDKLYVKYKEDINNILKFTSKMKQ